MIQSINVCEGVGAKRHREGTSLFLRCSCPWILHGQDTMTERRPISSNPPSGREPVWNPVVTSSDCKVEPNNWQKSAIRPSFVGRDRRGQRSELWQSKADILVILESRLFATRNATFHHISPRIKKLFVYFGTFPYFLVLPATEWLEYGRIACWAFSHILRNDAKLL